jgi:Icc-related predicted phosphoesterase
MKIHVLSDLHLEFGPITLPRVEADLVVLAGDVHTKRNGIAWIQQTFPEIPVIYITGNHEFYGEKTPGLIDKLKSETDGSNIHVLENEFVEIGGYRIFGATLWSDLALFGDPQIGSIEALAMNDYKRIRHSVTYRKLRPVDTRVRHLDSVKAIESFLATGDPRRSVVVTHHAPSIHSLPPDRRLDPVSCAYASHLDGLIQRTRPLLWVHGHIHRSKDYVIGETRIIANPRGYTDGPNDDFNPELVIEL